MKPEKTSIKETAKDLIMMILGTFILGSTISMFTVPNDIAPGGVSGLATALASVIPVIHVSVWNVLLNVPLLIAAWKLMGTKKLIYTICSTLLLSGFIELSASCFPAYTGDKLLAAFFGGVGSGLGVGLLFFRGISTGGTDLLALLLKKPMPNISSGKLLLAADAAVVIIAMIIFRDVDVALYSAITIFVSSKVIDALMEGADYAKVIYTVTDKGEDIARMVTEKTERSTTILPATGGYTGADKQMVLTVTRRSDLSETLRLIKSVDPDSFSFVTDSTEVHGEGFRIHEPTI